MDEAFQDTGVEITTVGNRHLGGALGVESFLERYICEKVLAWSSEIEQLSSFKGKNSATSSICGIYAWTEPPMDVFDMCDACQR